MNHLTVSHDANKTRYDNPLNVYKHLPLIPINRNDGDSCIV